jgi:enoyl-CoA hydratase/carnithine racemase
MEICLGGGDFSAEDAERYGYVNRALTADQIGAFVRELAERIASYPPRALALNKATVNLFEDDRTEDFITASNWFSELIKAADFDQRVDRFIAAGGQTAAGELQNFASWAARLSG